MMLSTESRLQQECFVWLWNSHHELRGLYFRIKNEGTNKISGARDKAMGILPGVADSCLLISGTAKFIEFKTEIGRQSETQKSWQKTVTDAGYEYFIIRTLNEFKCLIHDLLSKLQN